MKSFTFLVHNLYYHGGTTRSVVNLANCLAVHGHVVTIISTFRNRELPVYNLHQSINITALIDYTDKKNILPFVMNRIRKYTPFQQPKYLTPNEPGLKQFSRYIEKKIINAIQSASSDYLIGTRLSYNLLIAEYASNIMTIGMEHQHFNAYSQSAMNEMKQYYNRLNYISTLTKTDQLKYKHYFGDKVILIPNIVEQLHSDLPLKRNKIVILGRLEYEKGIDLALEALHMIKSQLKANDYKVHIYGDGSLKQAVLSLIKEYGLTELIEVHTFVNDISTALADSKITLIPSRTEGFGLVIFEAAAYKNSIISYNVAVGPEEFLTHRYNALVADPFNIKQFGEYILMLIDDDSLRTKLVINSEELLEQFSSINVYRLLQQQLSL